MTKQPEAPAAPSHLPNRPALTRSRESSSPRRSTTTVVDRLPCTSHRMPRTYLVAGTLEPFFLHNATRWAVALRAAGADVVMRERVASHGDALWRGEFPLMVAWAFGPQSMHQGADT